MTNNYKPVERNIARMLSRFPLVKKLLKTLYSRLVYVRNKKTHKSQTIAAIKAFTCNERSSFFGYYDKSPENKAGLVLANLTTQTTKQAPKSELGISLAVFKNEKAIFELPLKAYNWQQGSRAHWLNDDEFIVNDFNEKSKQYISRVYSVQKQTLIKEYQLPVQDSYEDKFFISLKYQRLMALRPDYGYRNLPILNKQQIVDLSNDGLWYMDFSTGNAELLISIQQACDLSSISGFEDAQHKFNHVMISPSGKQLIFMHRFLHGQRRFDRLLLLDIATKKLRLLADYGMVSHCFWVDENTILGYMRGPGGVDAYWLISLDTLEFSRLPNDALKEFGDGHPHVYGDWFVTDTYPDKARMQHLILCNWKTGETKKLGEFFHGFEFEGESRCDLHPRFSMDGKKVFFDSVFSGKRQLYSMDVDV